MAVKDLNTIEPVRLIPFDLYNISDFLVDEHPEIHPSNPRYKVYWRDHMEDCIIGKWGDDSDGDKGGWRWCPGNLYFYVNDCVITKEADGNSQEEIKPFLRDIEWLIYYSLSECQGFSGFEGDDEYTCYRPIGKKEKGEELLGIEELWIEKYSNVLKNKDGEYKKYIEAREYLYKTHDKPLGKPLYYNQTQDFLLFSTRGGGKSYGLAGDLTYRFTFGGARSIEDFLSEDSKSVSVVGAGKKEKSSAFLNKFENMYENLRKNIGAYNKVTPNINGPLYRPTEGSLSANSSSGVTNRVTIEGGGGKVGPGSEIHHVSFNSDPSAAAGYRANVYLEEVGLCPNFKKVHGENQATMESDSRFAFACYIGTGGQVEKTEEVQEVFENPRSFNVLPFIDNFSGSYREIGCFIPAPYRKNIYKDKNGNTDYKKAYADEVKQRIAKKKKSSAAYEDHCISWPIYPQEMFLSSEGNPFPTDMVDDRLIELKSNDSYEWKKKAIVCNIEYTNSEKTEANYYEDKRGVLKPVVRHNEENNVEGSLIEGAFVIYEPPMPNRPSLFENPPLYMTFYDPVLNDEGGSSLCVATVFKMFDFSGDDKDIKFNIVAEWVGRKIDTDDNHDQAFKLAALYNSRLLPETNIKDVKRFATKTGRYNMLEDTPWGALGEITKVTKYQDKGVPVKKGMIPYLERYLNDLLRQNVTFSEDFEYVGKEGLEYNVKAMVEECYSLRFLEELKFYRRSGNYDYVSTMMLAALWVKELEIQPVQQYTEQEKNNKINELAGIMNNWNNEIKANTAFNR